MKIFLLSSKDMLVKFWDLDTCHCFKTLTNHRSEVNDLALFSHNKRLVTGCQDNELRIYELTYKQDAKNDQEKENGLNGFNHTKNNKHQKLGNSEMASEDSEDQTIAANDEMTSLASLVECRLLGSLVRESKDPLAQICVDNTISVLGSLSTNEKHLEVFKIHTDEEIRKRLAKRIKKQKRQADADNEQENGNYGFKNPK